MDYIVSFCLSPKFIPTDLLYIKAQFFSHYRPIIVNGTAEGVREI